MTDAEFISFCEAASEENATVTVRRASARTTFEVAAARYRESRRSPITFQVEACHAHADAVMFAEEWGAFDVARVAR